MADRLPRDENGDTLPVAAVPSAREEIKAWLLDYAWAHPVDSPERLAEVDCIMRQGNWRHLSAQVEQCLAQRSGENTVAQDMGEAIGFSLSALYECHDGPHIGRCPHQPSKQVSA